MPSQQRRSLLIQPFNFRIGGVLAKFIKVNVGYMQDPWFEKQRAVDGGITTENDMSQVMVPKGLTLLL